MPFDVVLRIAGVLEVAIDVTPRWRGEGLDRLLDEAHARLVAALVARYRAGGWEVAVEASFSINGERGSVDVLGFFAPAALVAISEVKSVVPDGQATIYTLDRKSRLAVQIAAERGWTARLVVRFLAIGDDRTARRRIEAHEPMFRAAFPLVGRAALRWIDDPAGELASIRGSGNGSANASRPPIVDHPPDQFLANGSFRAVRSRPERVTPAPLLASGLFFLSPLPGQQAGAGVDSRHRVRPRRS